MRIELRRLRKIIKEELDAMTMRSEDHLAEAFDPGAYVDCFTNADLTDSWSSTIDKNSNQITKKTARIKELVDEMESLSGQHTQIKLGYLIGSEEDTLEQISNIEKRIKTLRKSIQGHWKMLEKARTLMTNHAISCEGGS